MGRLWQHGGVTLSSAAGRAHCSLAQGSPDLLFVRWFWRMAEVQGSGVESRGREGSESGSSGHTTGEQRVNLCCTTASSSQQLLSREKDTLSWLEGQTEFCPYLRSPVSLVSTPRPSSFLFRAKQSGEGAEGQQARLLCCPAACTFHHY